MCWKHTHRHRHAFRARNRATNRQLKEMNQLTPFNRLGPIARGFDLTSRARAAALHLGLSAIVAGLAAAMVLGVWYPSPFREISGGRELFTLVVAVDLVLGPLVTFAIFDRRKRWKELARDLAVVGALQLAGLVYGLHTVWQARPVYMVFEVDRFRVVRAIDIDEADLKFAAEGFRTLSWLGPKIIMAQPPGASEDVVRSIELAMAGRDINTQPKAWRPYDQATSAVLSRAKPLLMLKGAYPKKAGEIDAAVQRANLPVQRLAYLPVIARQTDWVVLVDNQTAQVVGYLPFGGF